VKWRFFRHLLGGRDRDSEHLYRWHIEKRSGARMRVGLTTDKWKTCADDYVSSARALFETMRDDGFIASATFAVPIDPNGELLDGSHRVACALAIRQDYIPVRREQRHVWAPAWDYEWFVAAGMGHDDLERLCRDFKELTAA